MDYSDIHLNDSLRGDADHLNCYGMKVMTNVFMNDLRAKRLQMN
jgi:hypothetical protein